jgi:hypothetical protein
VTWCLPSIRCAAQKTIALFALSIRGRYTATPKAYSRKLPSRQPKKLLREAVAIFLGFTGSKAQNQKKDLHSKGQQNRWNEVGNQGN